MALEIVIRERTKLLYISGYGRSGSTILANLLGAYDGFCSAGEIQAVWERPGITGDLPKLDGGWLCGCGAQITHCDLWSSVHKQAFGGFGNVRYEVFERLRKGLDNTRYAPMMALPAWRRSVKKRLQKYAEAVAPLYDALHAVTGCRVLIDESKLPLLPYTLAWLEGFELYIVHLVRDSRASAFSWKRRVERPDTLRRAHIAQFGTGQSALNWAARNLVAEVVGASFPRRYMRITYEKFVACPRETVMKIFGMLGEEPSGDPFLTDHEVVLGVNHTVWGNPSRLRIGPTRLEPDEEWKSKMSWTDKWLVSSVTWPLLLRYGYSV